MADDVLTSQWMTGYQSSGSSLLFLGSVIVKVGFLPVFLRNSALEKTTFETCFSNIL
jgi:hypothetical protein